MITVTYDDGGLAVNLAKAPQVTTLQLQHWMTSVVEHLHAAVARNIGNGGLIGRRSGNLARAILDRVTFAGGVVTGEVFPDPDKAPYGAIQESGGTVVPRTAQALTIPLEAMLTGNGVARGTAADVRANPQAFGFRSTFIPKGHAVIMAIPEGAKGESPIPIFALAKSVTIPAHGYLDVTLRQELTWILDALERTTDDIVSLSFGGDVEAA